MNRFVLLSILCVSVLAIFSCTSGKPTVFHDYYVTGKKPEGKQLDSLTADITLVFRTKEDNGSLKGKLYARPGEMARVELHGPLGTSAATILWKDQRWRFFIPSENRVFYGPGNTIPGAVTGPMGDVEVPFLTRIAQGDLLPEGWEKAQRTQDSTHVQLEWTCPEKLCSACQCKSRIQLNGNVDWLELKGQSDSLKVFYSKYMEFNGIKLPSHIRMARAGGYLKLIVRDVEANAPWAPQIEEFYPPQDAEWFQFSH